jgi:allantoicase
LDDAASWWDVVAKRRVQPDTRHRFLVEDRTPATHVRLDVYPDGGLTRLRCHGEVEADALARLRRVWWDSLPADHRTAIGDDDAPGPP